MNESDLIVHSGMPLPRTSRRDLLIGGIAATAAAHLPLASAISATDAANPGLPSHRTSPMITCIIRYQIDPYQRDAFNTYAKNWGRIIPRCGGHLIGYFLPHEGTNDIGWGLIAFENLAAYETYHARLAVDAEARENFAMAQSRRFILREERNFTKIVDGTFEIPARGLDR